MTFKVETSVTAIRTRYDLIIVGGGIVGLATAREFLQRQPDLNLLVVEKEAELCRHQSGHNSGVIHTGIYYTPGSLKARACVEGHRAVIEFCQQHGIPFELSGKLIVALDESELGRLNDLYERGQANGVAGLELIGPERMREIEPYAAGIKAIWSPTTGIVDYRQVALAYAQEVQEAGGEIITENEVTGFLAAGDKTLVQTKNQRGQETELLTDFVITCGGLYSDRLARLTSTPEATSAEVQIVPFRGDYYVLRPQKRAMVRSMIYPVPDPAFPFLGVHFTRRMDGEVWAGPNAVLAFAREGYGRWQINPKELAEALGFKGFRKLALKYWKMGLGEMYRDYYKAAYVKALQRYMPALTADDLLPGPSGVRAQALAADGRLVDDFLIRHGPHVIHVQNAPSPAATSSMIIARTIVDEAQKSFEMRGTLGVK